MSARTTRRAQSQAPLTHQESLLLAQAVWEVGAGPSSWASVSKLLSKHPLLSRPKAFFSAQACHTLYEQLMKDAELEINESCHAAHAPTNRALAERHYQLRHAELRTLIEAEEAKFKSVLKEIEAIRTGATGHKKEEITPGGSSAKETEKAPEDVINDSGLSGAAEPPEEGSPHVKATDEAADAENDEQTPPADASQHMPHAAEPSRASASPAPTDVQMDEERGGEEQSERDMQESQVNEGGDQEQSVGEDAEIEGAVESKSGKNESDEDDAGASENASQLREEEEEEETVLKQAEEEESKEEEEEEGSQGQQEEDVQMETEGDEGHATGEASEEEAPVVAARRSSRRRKSSAASIHPPPSRKRLRSQGHMSVDHEAEPASEEEDEDVDENEAGESESPQPEDEQPSSPFEGSTTRRGKRKASHQDIRASPSDKKRLREDSEPLEEDESGPSTNTRGGRLTRHATRAEDKVALKRFQNVIGMLHQQISQHRNGNIFHNPIKPSEAPDYHEIVKRPMDLKTIKTRVKDGVIGNSLEFQRDIYLMFANALVYNRPGSDVYALAEDMMLESEGQINAFRQTEGLVKRGQRQ